MQSCNARWLQIALFLLMLGCSDPQDASNSVQPDSGESDIRESDISESDIRESDTHESDISESDASEVEAADEATDVKTVEKASPTVEWTGVTVTEAELKAEPSMEASNLALLASGTLVTVRERHGGWYRVTAANSSGWLRMLAVATDSGQAAAPGRRELETAADIATGRSGSGNVVITTGIRGFDAQELASAKPDWEELTRLERFVLTRTTAAAAARALGLKAHEVRYLPRPDR